MNINEMATKIEQITTEFKRMEYLMKDASEAYDNYQECIMKLESEFALFRRLYFNLKDAFKQVVQPPAIDDSTIQPPKRTDD